MLTADAQNLIWKPFKNVHNVNRKPGRKCVFQFFVPTNFRFEKRDVITLRRNPRVSPFMKQSPMIFETILGGFETERAEKFPISYSKTFQF